MNATTHLLQGLISRGWTQMEVSRRTGIPQPRLSKWARGKAPSGAEDALKLKALADSGEPPGKHAAPTVEGQVQQLKAGQGVEVVHTATVSPAAQTCASSQTDGGKV